MADQAQDPRPPPEVLAYYAGVPEETRLESGPFRLEAERTRRLLARDLPAPPARVLDVGGGAGPYAAWLGARGYETHLIDASPRLVELARARADAASIASIAVGDARRLTHADASADAVLLLGPLYHLPEEADRLRALREAARVLRPGGVLFAAAISRFAPTLDGLARRLDLDPLFLTLRDRGLVDGVHRNETGRPEYFTTAYLHRPEDLRAELEAAGFSRVRVLGVEGPAWSLPDFDARWDDPAARADLLALAERLEEEPGIVGASAHLLGLGRKPGR